jgi:aspartyl/glutamyl-tRNA(Asn/Gln) amidotransferase C subunit
MAAQMAKLSKLARLELREEDQELLVIRLEKILESFESLQSLDLEGVEPLYGLNSEIHLRDDLTTRPIERELLMKNAADSFDGAYRVGRVLKS